MPGINRRPFFNTATRRRRGCDPRRRRWRSALNTALFRGMEGNPHGSAHTSFGGIDLASIGTAAKDPLFFLLHCNVDRLWAKWQRQNGRFDPAHGASYDSGAQTRSATISPDTMWPWNGVTGGTRPPTAPGGALATSPCVSAPGAQPAVRSMLDYQGAISAASRLGFDYDDVAF